MGYRQSRFIVALGGVLTVAVLPANAVAQITRLEIVSRSTSNDPSSGSVGPYEIIKGRAHGDLDPRDRRNAIIQDIERAPKNARGRVPYVATFTLARPLDPTKASGVLMYSVVNRGGGDVAPDSAGHVWLVSGWQGDVRPTPNNQTVEVPTAVNADGSPIVGLALARFSDLAPGTTTVTVATPRDPSATNGPIYRQAAVDQSAAFLISVASETTTGQQTGVVTIPRSEWAFADCRAVPFPGTPDRTRICLKGGFEATRLYQLVYAARDPLVLGAGLAATRDLVSYLRYDRAAENPVAGMVRHVVSIGNSQSGNFIKTFIHLGFNEDLAGRIVWDGAFPRIAARQTPMNFRFALPGGAGSLYEPGSEGVLTWGRYNDTARKRPTASLLDRCTATRTCPKVIEAFGATEFWGLRMSPGLIGTDARADVALPPNVRRFYYPGTPHGGGRGGFSLNLPAPGPNAACSLPANPNPQNDQTRALTVALVEWVSKGTEPPASRYPLVSQGQLVPATRAALGFPDVPQIPFTDNFVNSVLDYDFGQGFRANDLSGVISRQPPRIVQVIPTYVPKVDRDGNEVSGAASVLHQAPLATYLGWNVTASGFAKGRICGFNGGAVPFAKTRAERVASGDPRLSVEERYGTLEGYVCAVQTAAGRMVADRLLLEADAVRTIRQARESNILPVSSASSTEARAIEVRLCGGTGVPRASGGGSTGQTPAAGPLSISVFSNRADLLSGGDALVEIKGVGDPSSVRANLEGADVTSAFSRRSDGRVYGLITGLKVGTSRFSVRVGERSAAIQLTNHSTGGPVFSGPQVQPWTCSTDTEPTLGPALDAACNAPTRYRYVYRTRQGTFAPYANDGSTPADLITLSTPAGSVPFIVRVERGTMNRGIHELAVLFDPSRPWQPWAPQTQWARKVLVKYGAGTSQRYVQGAPGSVMDDQALAMGYLVVSSSMLVNGQHSNFVTAAETTMMLKEHIIEAYGEIRFTVGEGGSGGALLQHLIADAYPGLLDGLRPTQDWQDSISGAYREFADSSLLMRAMTEAGMEYTTEARTGIGGWGPANANVFNIENRRVIDYNRPDDGTTCAGDRSFNATTTPAGVRCTFQDFMASILGRRSDGKAPSVFDNVGVQYGLLALRSAEITPAQFAHLNANVGGYDIDGNWQATRSAIEPDVAALLHRTGQVTFGRGLGAVAELAIRGTNNNDYHYPFRTMVNRARLVAANGHANNHSYWIAPPATVSTLRVMDQWLAAVDADRAPGTVAEKVARNRPAEARSACWIDGTRVEDMARCDAAYPFFREPRTVAGDGPTVATMKCQLKPLRRSDYSVTFSDSEWAVLQKAFPDGVCDFSKPGVGYQPTVPWLSYAHGPGGQPLGAVPISGPGQ